MVAIFTGLGAGFERGSGSVLGGAGLLGSASLGRNGERLAVNAATGNMLVTQQDEFLVGRGPDSSIGRTYNSMEDVSDGDNSDHWRQSTTRTIHGLTGTLNTTGSTVKRTSGDGSDITYTWNGTAYVATDGNGAYDTLTNTAGVWTWTDGDTQFTEKYSAYGTGWRITELADTNGNKISFTYSGANLDRATTQNGEYEQYSWDANGNITDVVTHFGASNASTITRTHYAYTANKLTSVVVDLTPENTGDNVTYTTSYSYDTNGRIWVISETDGSSVTVLYDGSGRVSTLTQAVASGATRVTTFAYDTTNRKTTITDALSQQTVLSYDVNGNLTKIVSPAGQTQQFAYNANGDLTSVDKGNGEIVSYGYDTSGNRTSQQDALGNRVERTYLKGQVLTETRYVVPDPDAVNTGQSATVPQTTQYLYDQTLLNGQPKLNLLYSVSAEGTVTAYGYDAYGNQTSAIEYEGTKFNLGANPTPNANDIATWITGTADKSAARRTETDYDARGNVMATRGYSKLLSTGQFDTSSTKSETTYTYSQHGDLLTRLVSIGSQTRIESYTYDGLSRLKTTSDNDGIETSIVFADGSQTTTVTTIGGATQVSVYDLAGEIISYTESGSGAATATSTFKYDALGQLKLKKDALGQYTYFFYDSAGRKTAEVDALGAVTEYRYDPQNDVTSTTRYATRLNATQLASLVDGSGNPTAVTLDSLRPAASVDDQWTFNIYDLAQRLVQTIDGTGSTTVYTYDGLSQLVSTKQYAGKVSAADIAALKAPQSGAPNLIGSWSTSGGSLDTATGTFTQTATGTSGAVYQYSPVTTSGQTVTFTVTLKGGTETSAVIALYGPNTGWGNAGDATISLSGPGTATGYLGASFQISGLSATTPTTIQISRVYNAPDAQMQPAIWIGTGLSATAGKTIIISSPILTSQAAGAGSATFPHIPSYLPTADATNDRVTRMFYDKDGNLTGTLDADGYLTKIIYDAGGLKTQTIAYATATTPSLRAAGTFAQLLTSVGTPTSATSTSKYDALGQLKLKMDALGQYTYFFYDGAGRKTAEVDALGAVTEYRYDPQNDVTSTTRYATRLNATQLASLVDGSGNPTAVTLDSLRPAASVDDQWTFNIYDLAQRLVQTIDGTGSTTVYAYDGLSQLVSTKQYAGKVSAADIAALKAPQSGAPNLLPTDISLWAKGNVTVGSAGTINGANAYQVTQSPVGAYATVEFPVPPLAGPDQQVVFTITLMGTSAANSTVVALYGLNTGWGANADSSYEIVSGPGTIAAYGSTTAGATVSGLSTTVATVVRITRIFRSPETQARPFVNLGVPIVAGTASVNIISSPTLTSQAAGAGAAVFPHTPSYLPAADATNDRVSRMFYDKDGNLTGTLDAEGYLTQSIYDAAGYKTHTIAYATPTTAGLRASGIYADLLASVTSGSLSANDIHHWMLYDARGLLAAAIDGEGNLTRYSYTSQGYLAQQISGQQLNPATLIATPPTLATLPAAAGTTVLDTVSYVYNAYGQVQSQTRVLSTNPPVSTTTSYTYDQMGNLLSTTTQSGSSDPHAFSQRYDALGRVTSALNAEGNAKLIALGANPTQAQIDTIYATWGITYTYDADSRVIVTTEALGTGSTAARTLNYYNADGTLAYVISPLGEVTEYRYNALGQRTDTIVYAKRIAAGTLANMTGGAAGSISGTATITGLPTAGADSTVHVDYNVDGTIKDSIDALNLTTTYAYDAFGDLITEVDPLDSSVSSTIRTTRTYDRRGQLKISVVDSASGGKAITTSYGYDAFGRVLTLTDAATQTTTKTYDRAGRLKTSKDALNNTTTYSYDGRGNLAAVQDALNNVTRYVYDNAERLIYTVDALGGVTQNSYDNEGRVILSQAYATPISLGGLATIASIADIVALVVPASGKDEITHSVYDRDGKLRYSVDAGNYLTEFDYDATGNAIRSVAYSVAISSSSTYIVTGIQAQITAMSSAAITASPITRNVYNADGQRSYAIDALGYVTAYTYDTQGNVVKQQSVAAPYTATGDPTDAAMATWLTTYGSATNDRITRAIYDQKGQLRFSVDAESYVTQYTYNASRNVLKSISYADKFDGHTTGPTTFAAFTDSTTLAQAISSVAATPTAPAATTQFIYDSAGRLTETVDPMGVHTVMVLNQLGQATTTTVASGTADASVTTQSYDELGRVHSVTRAFGQAGETTTTTYGYDAIGNVLTVQDGRNNTITRTYDALGNALTVTVPLDASTSAVTTNTYDAFGNLVKVVDPLTRSGYFYYNVLNQLVLQVDPEGYATATSYTFTGKAATVTRYVAKPTGTPTITTPPTIVITAGQDAVSSFGYDLLDRVVSTTQVTDSNSANNIKESYGYNAFGDQTTVVNKLQTASVNGTTTNTFDKRGLLLSETLPVYATGTTYIANVYTYDARGNRLTMVEASGVSGQQRTTTYTYDLADRLTLTTHDAVTTVSDDLSTTTTNFAPSESLSYDLRGNVIKSVDANGKATWTYYDRLDRKIAQVSPLGMLSGWTYDANGNVLTATVYGDLLTTLPTTGGGTPPSPVSSTNCRTTTYAYDKNNRLISTTGAAIKMGSFDGTNFVITTDAAVSQITYDAAGNVILQTDARGGKIWSYYNALGQMTAQVDQENYLTTWTRDANGNVTSERRYANAASAAGMTTATRPVVTTSANDRVTLFTYDAAGRRLTERRMAVTGYTAVGSSVSAVAGTAFNWTSTDVDSQAAQVYRLYDVVLGRPPTASEVTNWVWRMNNLSGNTDPLVWIATDMGTGGVTGRLDATSNAAFVAQVYQAAFHRAASQSEINVWVNSLAAGTTRGAMVAYFTDYSEHRAFTDATIARNGVAYTDYNASLANYAAYNSSLVSYTYNGLGEVLTKQEANGDVTTYTYDGIGRVLTEVDPQHADQTGPTNMVAKRTTYVYDALNNVVKITVDDALGHSGGASQVTTYTYGAGGRLATTLDAAGFTHSFSYDAAGRTIRDSYVRSLSDGTSVTEALVNNYDAVGRVISQTHARLNASAWVFIDAAGLSYDKNWIRYNAYGDATGRGVTASTAGSAVYQETLDYDANGQVWSSNSGDGVRKFFIYDKAGNQTLVLSSAGADLSALTAANYTASITSTGGTSTANAITTVTVYDKRNMATQARQLDRYLAAGGPSTLVTTARTYNAFGEVASETDERAGVTTYLYNTMGRAVSVTRPAALLYGSGTAASPIDTYYYDISGRLVGSRDANTNLKTQSLLAGSGFEGQQALVTSEFHADGAITNSYDVFGNLRKVVEAVTTRVTNMEYDGVGHLTKATRPGGLLIDEYRYDVLGQRIKHWNNVLSDVERTDYDAQGRIFRQVAFGGDTTTIGYVWNASTATAGLGTFGGWTQTTTYANTTKSSIETTDLFSHMVSKSDMGGHVTTFTFDLGGRVTESAGGQTQRYTYLNTGLVSAVSTGTGVGGSYVETAHADYTYDKAGNKLTEYASIGGVATQHATATYDALRRMKTWTETGSGNTAPPADIAWEYDAVGNIIHMTSHYRQLSGNGTASGTVTPQEYWYRYDSMNRITTTKGKLSGGVIERGLYGIDITYNANGERATVTTNSGTAVAHIWDPQGWDPWGNGGEGGPTGAWVYLTYGTEQQETYTYNDTGTLAKVNIAVGGYLDNYDGTVTSQPAYGLGDERSTYTYDNMGRLTHQVDWLGNHTDAAYDHQLFYNAKGQVYRDLTYTKQKLNTLYNNIAYDSYSSDTNNYFSEGTSNYALGAVTSSTTTNSKNGTATPQTSTAMTYAWYDSAAQNTVTYTPNTSAPGTTQTTNYYYNGAGTLTSAWVGDGRPRSITVTSDALGQVIRRIEADSNPGGDPAEVWYRFNGKQIGYTGNNGTFNSNYDSSIQDRTATQDPTSAFRFSSGGSYGDFGQNYDPINSFAQGASGGSYSVRAGDTLQGIASAIWGDSSLWYKLAEANGLTSASALTPGQTLTIPAGVTKSNNNASTFRPYNPANAYGDSSPTTPAPQANPKNKCGVLGMILLIVIAVAITAILKVPILGHLATTAGVGGATATTAATGLIGALGTTAGTIVGGAVIGAVSSVVSQGIGLALGIQDKFNWKGVALAAIGGAVNGAVSGIKGLDGLTKAGEKVQGIGAVTSAIGRTVIGNVATQGIAVVTHLQHGFDWTSVATAAVSAGVGNWVGSELGVHSFDVDRSIGNIANTALTGAASGIAQAATRSLIDGTDFGDNLKAVLPDAIGQTIGDLIGSAIKASFGKSRAAGSTHTHPSGVAVSSDSNAQEISQGAPLIDPISADALGDLDMADVYRRIADMPLPVISATGAAQPSGTLVSGKGHGNVSIKYGNGSLSPGDGVAEVDENIQYSTNLDMAYASAVGNAIASGKNRADLQALAADWGAQTDFGPDLEPVLRARDRGQEWKVSIPQSGYRQRTWWEWSSETPVAAAVVGAANTITFGGLDEATGVINAFLTGNSVDQEIEKAHTSKQLISQNHPIAYFGGSIAGGVLIAPLVPEAATATGARLFATSAISGFAYGFLENNHDRIRGGVEGAFVAPFLGMAGKFAAPVIFKQGGKIASVFTGAFGPGAAKGPILQEGGAVSKLLYGGRVGEGLPGSRGVAIPARPTPAQLENLTAKHGVEFAVTYKFGPGRNGGGGQYRLFSGDGGSVKIPLERDSMLIYHTHPRGTRVASQGDMDVLRTLELLGSPQRSSQLIPVGRDMTVRFDSKGRNW